MHDSRHDHNYCAKDCEEDPHDLSNRDTDSQILTETSIINKDHTMSKIDYASILMLGQTTTYNLDKNFQGPVNTFKDLHCEQMTFPFLFPDGKKLTKYAKNT